MSKYRNKLIKIDAFKFGVDDVPNWFTGSIVKEKKKIATSSVGFVDNDLATTIIDNIDGVYQELEYAKIENSIDGNVKVKKGDYIVKTYDGEMASYPAEEFEDVFENIEQSNDKLKEICKPICEYIKANYDPYTHIIINDENVIVVKTELGIPMKNRCF